MYPFCNLVQNKYLISIAEEFVSTDPNDSLDPLIRAGKLTQEDWCILEWNESQAAYVLRAGIVCFPMRWSLQVKFNQPMAGKNFRGDNTLRNIYKVKYKPLYITRK